ncbi:hypothetical protein VMT65_18575 [Nocardia sp. CDC153]|uniref:WXG100-like domain-containing protein n=1 Tax=Nocardia sp. CDC153 TaxID=3112167 RepID=UPI002DB69C28|nr:hypothetical protein [Nocardia sp. CDC153]MEC3955053.1 hypothetical protein [Nocardia sp. CDC153]
MALYLPPELDWLGWLVGVEWPEGNEDRMWELATHWKEAAEGLRAQVSKMNDAKYATLSAYVDGDGRDAMAKIFDNMAGVGGKQDGNTSILDLAGFYDQIGDSVHDTGTEIESTKLMFYSSLVILAAEMVAAWVFPPTAPAAEAAAQAATRVAVRIIAKRALAAIERQVAKLVGSTLAKFMVRHFVLDAGLGLLQEVGIEEYQKAVGHRKDLDWNKIAVTGISSAAGGIGGGKVGKLLGERFENSMMRPFLAAGITGVSAGLAGAGTGFLAGTVTQFGLDAFEHGMGDAWKNMGNAFTHFDPRMLTGGGFNGGVSGLNHTAATNFWEPRVARMRAGVSTDLPNVGSRPDMTAPGSSGHAGGGDAGGNLHSTGFAGDTGDSGAGVHHGGDGSSAHPQNQDVGGMSGDSRGQSDRGTPESEQSAGPADHSQPGPREPHAPADLGTAGEPQGTQAHAGTPETTGAPESGVQAGRHENPAPTVDSGASGSGPVAQNNGPAPQSTSTPTASDSRPVTSDSRPVASDSRPAAAAPAADQRTTQAAADSSSRTSAPTSEVGARDASAPAAQADSSTTASGTTADSGPGEHPAHSMMATAAQESPAGAAPAAAPADSPIAAASTGPAPAASTGSAPTALNGSAPSVSNGNAPLGAADRPTVPAAASPAGNAPAGAAPTSSPHHGGSTPEPRTATPDPRPIPTRAGEATGLRADTARPEGARPQSGTDARPQSGTDGRPQSGTDARQQSGTDARQREGTDARPDGTAPRSTPESTAPHDPAALDEPATHAAPGENEGRTAETLADPHDSPQRDTDPAAPAEPENRAGEAPAAHPETTEPAAPREDSAARTDTDPSAAQSDSRHSGDEHSSPRDDSAPPADTTPPRDEQSQRSDSDTIADESGPRSNDSEPRPDTPSPHEETTPRDETTPREGNPPRDETTPREGNPPRDETTSREGNLPRDETTLREGNPARDETGSRPEESVPHESDVRPRSEETPLGSEGRARGDEVAPADSENHSRGEEAGHEPVDRVANEPDSSRADAEPGKARRVDEPESAVARSEPALEDDAPRTDHPEPAEPVHDSSEPRRPAEHPGETPERPRPADAHPDTESPKAGEAAHDRDRDERPGHGAPEDGLLVAPIPVGDHPIPHAGEGERRAAGGERSRENAGAGPAERPAPAGRRAPTDGPGERRAGPPERGDGTTKHPGNVREPQEHPASEPPPRGTDSAGPQPDRTTAANPHPNRGRSGELALKLLRQLTGNDSIRVPERPVGPEGMSASRVVSMAGGRLRGYEGHEAIADRLRELGPGASALVVDRYAGPADEHGVGAHAYLLVNDGGKIVVKDPATGREHGFPPEVPGETRSTHAILFKDDGTAVEPLSERTRQGLDPVRARRGRPGVPTQPDDMRARIERAHLMANHEVRKAIENLHKVTGLRVTESDLAAGKLADTMRDLEGRATGKPKGDPQAALDRLRTAAEKYHGMEDLKRAVIAADLAQAAERAHAADPAHPDAPARTPDPAHTPDPVAAARAFEREVTEAIRSGEASVEVISEGALKSAERVELVTFEDGTELIRKVVTNPAHADAEELASLVGRAVGVEVPRVYRDPSNEHIIYMDLMPGDTAAYHHETEPNPALLYHGTPEGLRMGLFDALLAIPDRNPGNWMVSPDGHLIGIDHSLAFGNDPRARNPISQFARQFAEPGPNRETVWHDHELTRSEVAEIRARVDALAPEFERAGRPDWHQAMRERLDQIEQHARPDEPARPENVPPAEWARVAADATGIDAYPVDEWTKMSPSEVARELHQRWNIDVVGFDDGTVHPAVAQEFARAIDDMLGRYPVGRNLERVEIKDLGDNRLAQVDPGVDRSTPGNYLLNAKAIQLNAKHAGSLADFHAITHDPGGFHPPNSARRPVYATIVHEFGHALDFESGKPSPDSYRRPSDDALQVLRDYFETTRPDLGREEFRAAFEEFLGQLSGYSLSAKDEHGNPGPRPMDQFEPVEAVAEAFMDVEYNGERASEPAKVLYWHLMDEMATYGRNPDSFHVPPDAISRPTGPARIEEPETVVAEETKPVVAEEKPSPDESTTVVADPRIEFARGSEESTAVTPEPEGPAEKPAAGDAGAGSGGKEPPVPPHGAEPEPEPEPNPAEGGNPTPTGENTVPTAEAPTVELPLPEGEHQPPGGEPGPERPDSVNPAVASPTLKAVTDYLSDAPLEHNARQRTPEELAYLARLADALGMAEPLSRRPDALASLQELAEMARARGFFGDPETGTPPGSMRDPRDFRPLTTDERYGGEEYWRSEVDPRELAAIEAEFRDLGIADRLSQADAAEAATARAALEQNTSGFTGGRPDIPLEPWSDPAHHTGEPRALTLDELRRDIAARLGLSDADIAKDRLPETAGELQYRNMLRAGGIEALDEAAARHDAATDPEHRAQLAQVRDEWARLLGVDPERLAPEHRAETMAELRAETIRRATDIADLMAATYHEPDPSAPQRLVLEAGGDRVHVTVRTDADGVRHLEPATRPALPGDRLPAARQPVRPPFLRRLWDFVRGGFTDQNPKYASGSGLDGKGQKEIIHEVGGWLHNDFLEHLDINPARLGKEFATFWKQREELPFFNRLTARVADTASELVPMRTRDGEYQPWLSEVDPATAARAAEDLRLAGISNEDPAPTARTEAEPVTDPAAVDQREHLPQLPSGGEHAPNSAEPGGGQHDPATDPQHESGGSRDVLPKALADGLDLRDQALQEVLNQAARQGIDLRAADPPTLRRLVDEATYVLLRRAGAVEALFEVAQRYNVEDARVPFSRSINFFDKDPLGRFLRELVHSDPTRQDWAITRLARKIGLIGPDDPHFTALEWAGSPNGGEPARNFDDLSPEELTTRKEGVLFDNALMRDQMREERSNWAQLLGVGLDELSPERLPHTVAELRMAIREHADQVADLGRAVDEYLHADAEVRKTAQDIADDAARVFVAEHGGATLDRGIAVLPGDPPRLQVISASGDHEQVLATYLAEHPEVGRQLNDGQLGLDFRLVTMDDQGRLHVVDEHTPEVRFHEPELGGEKIPATTVRDHPTQPWRVVEERTPATPTPHETPEPLPRTLDELRTARDELAKKLAVYREDLTPDKLADTIKAMQLDNALRAAQIEGMADFIRSSDGIASFHDLNGALQQLAHRLNLDPSELSPRRMAEALADPGLRNVRRLQAVQDLVEYAAGVRGVDEAAALAARDRLAERLGVRPESLFSDKYDKKADRFGPDPKSIESAALLRAINDMMHRSAERPELLAALTEYADSLSAIDPYHHEMRFDPASDPRVAEGELPIHDPDAAALLRTFNHELIGEAPRSDQLSHAGEVWARLQGLELGDDPKRLAKAYEAYRDGKIEKFERPTDAETRATVAELRAEARARARDIEALRRLAEEYNAVTNAVEPERPPARPADAAAELDSARTDLERAGKGRDYALSRITHPDAHEPHLDGAPGRRIGPQDLTPQRLASTIEHLERLPMPDAVRPGHEARIAELRAAAEHYNATEARVRAAEHELNRSLMAGARPGEAPVETLRRELDQALRDRDRAMRGVRVEASDLTPERFRDALDEATRYARTPEQHAEIGPRIQRLHDAAVRVHQIEELIAGHEAAAAARARAAESPLDAARRESTAAQRELRAARTERDLLMNAPKPNGAEEFAARDTALRAALDRVDRAQAAADRWSAELKRLWAAHTRAAVTPHEAAARARDEARAALQQAITEFRAATRLNVAESDLVPARLDSTIDELQGKTALQNGPGSATAFEDLRRAAENSHHADALARWVEDNVPHPTDPNSGPSGREATERDPGGPEKGEPKPPSGAEDEREPNPSSEPEHAGGDGDSIDESLLRPKSDPNDPDTWFDRMQAEQADWSARMEAKHARWLHEIADRMVPGSTEERFARLRAENADLLARIAADRADWYWEMAGGRPDEGPAAPHEGDPGEEPPTPTGSGSGGDNPPNPPHGNHESEPEGNGSTPSAREGEPLPGDEQTPSSGEKSNPAGGEQPQSVREAAEPQGEHRTTEPQGEHEATVPNTVEEPVASNEAEAGVGVHEAETQTLELTHPEQQAEEPPASVNPAHVSPTLRAIADFLADAPVEHNARPRLPEDHDYLRRLAEALGMSEPLSRRKDPLASLQELAEMAKARGFFGDPETGDHPTPMRNPEDFRPLTVDERYGDEEYWRTEAEEPPEPPRNEAPPGEAPSGTTHSGAPEHLPLDPWSEPAHNRDPEPRAISLDELRRDIAERLGLSDADIAKDRLPVTAGELQYRNMLRAGAIEALAEAAARHDSATDPGQRARAAKVRDEWARLLGVDPEHLAPEHRAAMLAELRIETIRRAEDVADLVAATFHEPDPAAPRRLVLEADGQRIHVLVHEHPDGTPRLERTTRPALPGDRAPEVPAEPRRPFLRRLWDFVRGGFMDPTPKYPSGSSLDSKAFAEWEKGAAVWFHNDSLVKPNDDSNPFRPVKEVVTLFKSRERWPFLKNAKIFGWELIGKVHEVSGVSEPMRTRDGEYEPWLTEVDEHVLAEANERLRFAELPVGAEQRPELPAGERPAHELTAGPQTPHEAEPQTPHGAKPEAPREALPKSYADALDNRDAAWREVAKQAARQGIDLRTADPATVRRLVEEANYILVRRAGAVEALALAADRYNAQDARIPYSKQISFYDKDPLARLLRELMASDPVRNDPNRKIGLWTRVGRKLHLLAQDSPPITFVHWQPVGNNEESTPHFWDPSPEELLNVKEGVLFQNAVLRDQLREARSNWAQLLGVGLDELTPERLPHTLAELRMAVREHGRQLADLAHAADDYFHAEAEATARGTEIADDTARSWVREQGGASLEHGIGILPGDPPRLTVIRGDTDHLQVLAGYLAEHPEIGHQLNDGRLRLDIRGVDFDQQGRPYVYDETAPEVRFHQFEVNGEPTSVLLARDSAADHWQLVERPHDPAVPPVEPERPTRTVDELRTARDELAKKLVVYRDDLTPAELDQAIKALRHANALHAAQIEGMADFIATAKAIESYHGLNDLLDKLAGRLGIDPAELTPQRLAEAMADPGVRKVRRLQAVEDLLEYAKALREVSDESDKAVLAARDRLAERLGVDPEQLYAETYDKKADRWHPAADSVEPKAVLRAVNDLLHRSAERPELLAALAEYADSLAALDPFHTDLHFDPSRDPRVAEGELPIHDPHGPGYLRDHLHEDLGEALPLDEVTHAESVWARLQGLELDGDPAHVAELYERYRDGKIEAHEILDSEKTAQKLDELRAEVRQRAADIEELRRLADEYNRATAPHEAETEPPHPKQAAAELDSARSELDTARAMREYALGRLVARPDEHAPHLDAAPGRPLVDADLTPSRLPGTLEHLRRLPVAEGQHALQQARVAEFQRAAEQYNAAEARVRAAERGLENAALAGARPGETPADTVRRALDEALAERKSAIRGVRVNESELTPERYRDALDEAAGHARTPAEHDAIGPRIEAVRAAAVRVHQLEELLARHEEREREQARAAETPIGTARRESAAAQTELDAARRARDEVLAAPKPSGAEEFAARDDALRSAVDRVDAAQAAADRWSAEVRRLEDAAIRAGVSPHEGAAAARDAAHTALLQAITDFRAATGLRVHESELTPEALAATLDELRGKTALQNGPGSRTPFEDLHAAAEAFHHADALAHWVDENIPHPGDPASSDPEEEGPTGGAPATPHDPTQPGSDGNAIDPTNPSNNRAEPLPSHEHPNPNTDKSSDPADPTHPVQPEPNREDPSPSENNPAIPDANAEKDSGAADPGTRPEVVPDVEGGRKSESGGYRWDPYSRSHVPHPPRPFNPAFPQYVPQPSQQAAPWTLPPDAQQPPQPPYPPQPPQAPQPPYPPQPPYAPQPPYTPQPPSYPQPPSGPPPGVPSWPGGTGTPTPPQAPVPSIPAYLVSPPPDAGWPGGQLPPNGQVPPWNSWPSAGTPQQPGGLPEIPGGSPQIPEQPGTPSLPGVPGHPDGGLPHGPGSPAGPGRPTLPPGAIPDSSGGQPAWNGHPGNGFNGSIGSNGAGSSGAPMGSGFPGPAGAPAGQQQGANGGRSRGGNRFPRASGPSGSGDGVFLRSHSGFGEFAMLNPFTGDLRSAPAGAGSLAGVYDDLDGLRVIFYRDNQAGLVLRVGDQALELDRLGAEVQWERTQHGFNRLSVMVAGAPQCEVRYRPLATDADLGMLIRDVLADPVRRSGIFG